MTIAGASGIVLRDISCSENLIKSSLAGSPSGPSCYKWTQHLLESRSRSLPHSHSHEQSVFFSCRLTACYIARLSLSLHGLQGPYWMVTMLRHVTKPKWHILDDLTQKIQQESLTLMILKMKDLWWLNSSLMEYTRIYLRWDNDGSR